MESGDRRLILERAGRLRSEKVLRDLSFGRLVATIPIEDYYRLIRERPELKVGDRVAWAQFLTSDEARPFLVTGAAAGRYLMRNRCCVVAQKAQYRARSPGWGLDGSGDEAPNITPFALDGGCAPGEPVAEPKCQRVAGGA